jgi:hypothetical protein
MSFRINRQDLMLGRSMPSTRLGIVVLGAPRSGTTLLANVVGAHPRVAMMFEELHGGAFRVVGGKIPAVKLCTPNQVDLDRRWGPMNRVIGLSGWLRKNVGYRMPTSRLSLRDMMGAADLRILCLIRDPARALDAIRRRERLSEAVSHDILTRTYHLFNALHAEPRARCQVVSLDRLLRAPEPQIRKLCAWLGLEFDAAMLDAPQYNHLYPEAGFRSDRAAGAPDGGAADPASRRKLALLQPSYDALLARAA